jgi:hypothetical protein
MKGDKQMRILRFLGVAGFALAMYAMPCAAQNIPPGSYQQTCRNIQPNGNRLDAECQTRDGNWHRTSLNLDRCGSTITNDNGNLVCDQGYNNGYGYGNRPYRRGDRDNDADDRRGGWQGGGWQGNLPPGDYVQTCRSIRMNGDHMDAQCQKKDGGWRNTSLDNVSQCGGIVNNNGRLQCGSGGYYNNGYGYPNNSGYGYGNNGYGYNGNNPPGDYVQTCRNIQTNGNRLDAECQTRDGNWRRTSLNNLDRCNSPVANDNGHLVCGR